MNTENVVERKKRGVVKLVDRIMPLDRLGPLISAASTEERRALYDRALDVAHAVADIYKEGPAEKDLRERIRNSLAMP